MLNPEDILRLYGKVLETDIENSGITRNEIRNGIRNMAEAYKPNKINWTKEISTVTNYDDAAHRCAYLHKYAPLHTSMVQEMFRKALISNNQLLTPFLFSNTARFKICSLGGGPGTDVIGVLSAVYFTFGLQRYSVQVVELMSKWEDTFDSIVDELRFGCYGPLSANLSPEYFSASYVAANLLHRMNDLVNRVIQSANLITMVKFVSAATCKNTAAMVKKIFNSVRPGALVLFIDNAAGGFSELICRLSHECKLVPAYGPLNHVRYANDVFKLQRYGYESCSETRVTVSLLTKPYRNSYENSLHSTLMYHNQNLNFDSDDNFTHHSASNVLKSKNISTNTNQKPSSSRSSSQQRKPQLPNAKPNTRIQTIKYANHGDANQTSEVLWKWTRGTLNQAPNSIDIETQCSNDKAKANIKQLIRPSANTCGYESIKSDSTNRNRDYSHQPSKYNNELKLSLKDATTASHSADSSRSRNYMNRAKTSVQEVSEFATTYNYSSTQIDTSYNKNNIQPLSLGDRYDSSKSSLNNKPIEKSNFNNEVSTHQRPRNGSFQSLGRSSEDDTLNDCVCCVIL